jgi:hypothetical protein
MIRRDSRSDGTLSAWGVYRVFGNLVGRRELDLASSAAVLSAGFTRFSDQWLRGVLTPDAINSMGALRV